MGLKRYILIFFSVFIPVTLIAQLVVEWDEISNWVGAGDNKAAIGVQFNDGYAEHTYIWGYRWSGEEWPVVRDAMTEIAQADRSLVILEQLTSKDTGKYTLAGMGYDNARSACNDIYFDFNGAKSDSRINFNYYAPGCPGDNTPTLCKAAIEKAVASNVIEHPINAETYTYPAYDYDHWLRDNISFDRNWNSGWITGNWIAWKGTAGSDKYDYKGMAYSSLKIEKDDVVIWNFNRHTTYPVENDYVDGYTGATSPVRPAKYTEPTATIHSPADETSVSILNIFDINGRICSKPLKPGLYIVLYSDYTIHKIIVNQSNYLLK